MIPGCYFGNQLFFTPYSKSWHLRQQSKISLFAEKEQTIKKYFNIYTMYKSVKGDNRLRKIFYIV